MSRLASILQRINLHRIFGNGRTIPPDQLQRIEVRTERDATLFTEAGNHVLHIADRTAPPVDANFSTGTTLTAYPLSDGGCALNLQAHQLKLRSLQLLFSSQEIPRVRPQGCSIHCDHCRSRRAIETADPLTAFPMLGHVFTLMGVSTGENKRCKMFPLHHFTEIG